MRGMTLVMRVALWCGSREPSCMTCLDWQGEGGMFLPVGACISPLRLAKCRLESSQVPMLSWFFPPQFLTLLSLPWGCDCASSRGVEESLHWLEDRSQVSGHKCYPLQCGNKTAEGDGLQGQILLLDSPHDPSHFNVLHLLLIAPGT